MDIQSLKQDIRTIQDIESDEGFSSSVYFDNLGYATIGYGRMIDKRLGGGITKAEAEYLLDNDLQASINDCDQNFSWFSKLSDARQRAIVEMRFQLGLKRLLGFVDMLIDMENYDFLGAAAEALNSKWASQCPNRAQRIAGLIKNG